MMKDCTFLHKKSITTTRVGMSLGRTFEVVFSETNFTTSLTAIDQSMTLNDVLRVNGLTPRDGTFRYLSSSKGTMINHLPVGLAPDVVSVEIPKNIAQIWIDSQIKKGRAFVSNNDARYVLFGAKKDAHANVFITKWKIKNMRCGYSFSPVGTTYEAGSIVFIRVPLNTNQTYLFNPKSGKEDYTVQLQDQDIESLRGFWSAWEIQEDLTIAKYRRDITPLPANYAPPRRKIKPSASKGAGPKSKENGTRRINMKSIHLIKNEPKIHSCNISKKNPTRKAHAIVCGLEVAPPAAVITGHVAAWGNKSRPTMINAEEFRYGMSHFVKIPEEGRFVPVYNPVQKASLQCRLTDSPDLRVDDLRGRWVVAQLRRHGTHKRILKLHSMPSDFV